MRNAADERERLLAEAAALRDRARRLAARFVRRVRHRHAAERRELAAQREHLAKQIAKLNAARSEFHAATAAATDRLNDAWATVEAQQRRVATDLAEAERLPAAQLAALDARTAELDAREKAAADRLASAEAEAAGLREEAVALEERVRNTRAALAELEARRDRARAELLHTELPFQVEPAANADDLAHRELLLEREKGAVAALRSALELESADLDDRRRLVAEQLAQLAEARAHWQRAERQTVAEMEQLARALASREQALDAREARLVRADASRREEAHDLWRLRLRLEAWQSRLAAFELRWHTEREELEANLKERLAAGGGMPLPPRRDAAGAASAELAALREEIERLAASVIEIEFPGLPEMAEVEGVPAAEGPEPASPAPVSLDADARAA